VTGGGKSSRSERRCVLVTGGSRGIGAEAARRFAEAGDDVAILYRQNDAAAEEVVDALRASGAKAEKYRADIGRPAEVTAAVDRIHADFGRIDVLVNNAAKFETAPFEAIDGPSFDELLHTNLLGPIAAIQACLPYLPEGGRIVNIISVLALTPRAGSILYSATKAALRAVAQGLVEPLAQKGITINCVAPGVILTDMMEDVPQAALDRVAAETPLGRIGLASDVAPLILFLASSEAKWMTGRTLVADGGRITL
jgi:Dehydrogenases with different specificities (related to short-chain alcohol dehydrogenases)